MNTRRSAPQSEVDRSLLREIKELTDEIRVSQNDISSLSDMRRMKIIDLRRNRITYREIAEAMEVTEQNVYKILRSSIAENRQEAADPNA